MDENTFFAWKNEYWNIYYIEMLGEEFLFRELSRAEYKRGIRLYKEDPTTLEEYVCSICVLEPEGYDFSNCVAGIPSVLSDFILLESGFSEDTGKLAGYMNKYRKEMETLDNQMACIIKEAFSDLSIEEIENWSMEKTIWYYSRSEYILSLRGIDLAIEVAGDKTIQESTKTKKPKDIKKPDIVEQSEEDRKFDIHLAEGGSAKDFPEVGEIQAFMKGKWMSPPVIEGEELL